MDPNAVRIANERLWAAHPELGRRQLTDDPADASHRSEWMKYYNQAIAASPPPTAIVPSSAPPPPPAATVIASCPVVPVLVKTSDCKEVKKHVQEGDIVLRGERGQNESDFLAKVSGCKYSHAGIVARNDKGEMVVVDAYPGRGPDGSNTNAVNAISVDSFFCDKKYGATHGIATRPNDSAAAKKAAKWAIDQSEDPDYKFDLWDPWNSDPKRLYCADFVYQSYQNAGVDLVPDKMDFLSPSNRQNTINAAREFKGGWAKIAPDKKIEKALLEQSGGNSEYITPCQVGMNPSTSTVVEFDTANSSESSGGKKSGD